MHLVKEEDYANTSASEASRKIACKCTQKESAKVVCIIDLASSWIYVILETACNRYQLELLIYSPFHVIIISINTPSSF
jgi:hypothetical protein